MNLPPGHSILGMRLLKGQCLAHNMQTLVNDQDESYLGRIYLWVTEFHSIHDTWIMYTILTMHGILNQC